MSGAAAHKPPSAAGPWQRPGCAMPPHLLEVVGWYVIDDSDPEYGHAMLVRYDETEGGGWYDDSGTPSDPPTYWAKIAPPSASGGGR